MLVAPKPKEELIIYLSASYGAISAVFMTERDTVQTLVYFVSRAASSRAKLYPNGKASHGASLRHQKVTQILSSASHWEYNITYQPRTSVKGQILADFLVEKPDDAPLEASMIETPQEPWALFMAGSSCVNRSGAGQILTSPKGTEFTYALRFQFAASNNEAEYEVLIAGLQKMGVRNVQVSVDSKLVANQVLGTYIAKEENMIKYLEKTKSLALVLEAAKRLWYGALRTTSSGLRPGKVKFLTVAMDYFTKWIEAKAVATISGSQVKNFVWDNIVCHFGLLGEIISDNGKQFSGDPFKDCLGERVKAHLDKGNKNWLEELPHVFWAHLTMIKSSNNDTLFSLTYGTEAIIPAEIRMPTHRTAVGDAVHNDEELHLNRDLLEERRERAAIREAKAKLNMTK
ncbi:reverse transcriptase domain-containing protein, partial [Tanacetum coccineum]